MKDWRIFEESYKTVPFIVFHYERTLILRLISLIFYQMAPILTSEYLKLANLVLGAHTIPLMSFSIQILKIQSCRLLKWETININKFQVRFKNICISWQVISSDSFCLIVTILCFVCVVMVKTSVTCTFMI